MEKYTGKMIPFDIEKWKAGYEPVYRDGAEVLEVAVLDKADGQNVISVNVDRARNSHYPNGSWMTDNNSSCDKDLMLKAKEVVKWVNVYKDNLGMFFVRNCELYCSEELAKRCGTKNNYHATVEIRIPE